MFNNNAQQHAGKQANTASNSQFKHLIPHGRHSGGRVMIWVFFFTATQPRYHNVLCIPNYSRVKYAVICLIPESCPKLEGLDNETETLVILVWEVSWLNWTSLVASLH
ncbi:hypothetical protein AMECASPLE_031811 [Ameca splendens]|uniref:Uncharacterized protein n=1 Tax=Ameca splendens TaxID=208324 RepID=A0ABV0XJI8_9TELE